MKLKMYANSLNKQQNEGSCCPNSTEITMNIVLMKKRRRNSYLTNLLKRIVFHITDQIVLYTSSDAEMRMQINQIQGILYTEKYTSIWMISAQNTYAISNDFFCWFGTEASWFDWQTRTMLHARCFSSTWKNIAYRYMSSLDSWILIEAFVIR